MRRYIAYTIGGILLVFFGIGIGYLLNHPTRLPISGGEYANAPDKGCWAITGSWEENNLLRSSHRIYSELSINALSPDPTVVRRVRIEDTGQDPCIDWREEGHIQWLTNSSAVTFSYDGPKASFQLTLKMRPSETSSETNQAAR